MQSQRAVLKQMVTLIGTEQTHTQFEHTHIGLVCTSQAGLKVKSWRGNKTYVRIYIQIERDELTECNREMLDAGARRQWTRLKGD